LAKRKPDCKHCHWLTILKKNNLKKIVTYLFVLLLILATGTFVWWQYNKKKVVKNQIENAVTKATDNAYFIHYDSSSIDEVAGNASFYNIVLQSDSLQKMSYLKDTADLPATLFNIRIEKLSLVGADIPSFLNKNTIETKSIEITKPIITIIQTGAAEKRKFTAADTLALYEKLIGKFKSIKAGEINIKDADVRFTNNKEIPQTTLQGINIALKNLIIDSTKNYDNIISYFIKDVVATVKKIDVINNTSAKVLTFENTEYNAVNKFLKIDKIIQTDIASNRKLMQLTKNKITGISTTAFIINKQLKADSLSTDGGELIIYKKKSSTDARETIEMENDFFDEASIKNINIGNTSLIIYNYNDKNEAALVLNNVQFKAANIAEVYSGTNIMRLVSNSNWKISGDGTSFFTNDKMYKINIGSFILDNKNGVTSFNNVDVIPTLSETNFAKQLRVQKDRYDVRLKNIRITNLDFKQLISNRMVVADAATLSPILNIYNDKTVKEDPTSKIGKYPQQLLQKLATNIYIKKLMVNNGYIKYRERGEVSKNVGDVFFNDITGTVSNFTNIDSYIKSNNIMTVDVTCKFLNVAPITTTWLLPLNSSDGSFTITGKVGTFDAAKLNAVTEPLGLASINSGTINSFVFTMKGNDVKASGDAVLLYDNLKVTLLKKVEGEAELKNKGALSALANVFIKNQNPTNGIIRKGNMAFDRVMNKSFFNLVWKSIFAGAKTSTK
jgi:hypothetical protein